MTGKKALPFILLSALLILITAGCSTVPIAVASPLNEPTVSQASANPQVIQTPEPGSQGITVVGTGAASGSPDVANVSLGVQTQNTAVQQAVRENQSKMNAVINALKTLGIADKDIQTTNYSIYTQQPPVVNQPSSGSNNNQQPAYVVNNQVNVTVRDLTKLSNVLDQSISAGANNVNGVSFSVSNPSQLQAEARSKAVDDAKTKAQDLARLLGVNLGNVISVSEVSANPSPVFAPAQASAGASIPIQTGELSVSVTIQVTYGIK